jgi:hypothetical protein
VGQLGFALGMTIYVDIAVVAPFSAKVGKAAAVAERDKELK